MAAKISTLILKVDLDCHLCYKKIRKTLSKLQEKEPIQSIVYDEKNNTVLVSGPFDPHRMIKKICCKACKVIKDIQIKADKPKEAEPPKEKPKEKPAEPVKEKPKEKPAEPVKEKPKEKPAEPVKEKPKEKTVESEPVDTQERLPVGVQTAGFGPGCQPFWPGGPGCYCRPWYEGYYGDYRGCTCGCGGGYGPYGWAPERPPIVVYGGPAYGGGGGACCKFICEEDPQSSCSVM
ncbi:protein PYRICULARIA ORYZAE RESISTANCE 21-like [Iris pallida]|uniref:Protein PYRICULARIA ORYZAE RESISTANCE 21-like n=1 Tax=Iris pallida TaxID=29817 RepID=A0AAX6GGK4_IRIPA|nr:protein PYRICULARIA ORYZAE RESISTANCE 21-like [Iris pallida]KAJ6827864.1 protein PYRICULARIA ORYZAE RESISTANCE 21-like [Iris pallida]